MSAIFGVLGAIRVFLTDRDIILGTDGAGLNARAANVCSEQNLASKHGVLLKDPSNL